MSDYQKIHYALTKSLIDLNLGFPISYENDDFNPVVDGGEQFLNVATLFTDQVPIDKTKVDEVHGIFQVSVYVKTGTSTAALIDTVSRLTQHYKFNAKFTGGTETVIVTPNGKSAIGVQTVVITSVGRSGGRNDGGWYIDDVSINFKSDILR
jgi:hypothetical protein